MRLICPSCGAMHSLEGWGEATEERKALIALAELARLAAPVAALMPKYLALFRPTTGRGLAMSRVVRLIQELRALIGQGHIQWERMPARNCSAGIWAQAMQQIIDKPPGRLPLKSHGYLRAIAYELADQADKMAEQQRRALENSGGFRRPDGATSGDPQPLMTKEQMQDIRKKHFRLRAPGT